MTFDTAQAGVCVPAGDSTSSAAATDVIRPGRTRWRAAAALLAVAIAAPLLLLLAAGPRVGPISRQGWMITLKNRKDAAARDAAGPKVIFVGGSSVLFGVDAPALQRRLGRPVVNYGLHAQFGVDLIAEQAAKQVGAGDVVVLAPELWHFKDRDSYDVDDPIRIHFLTEFGSSVDRQTLPNPVVADYRIARARAYTLVERIHLKWDAVVPAPPKSTDTSPADAEFHVPAVYNVDAYDAYGNLIVARPRPAVPERAMSFGSADQILRQTRIERSRAADALRVLADACRTRNATLYVIPSIHIESPRGDDFTPLERAWLDFAVAHGGRALLAPGQTAWPYEYAFDTQHHLNDRGARAMTERLATALGPALPPPAHLAAKLNGK